MTQKMLSIALIINLFALQNGAALTLDTLPGDISHFESLVQATSLVGDNAPVISKRLKVVITAYSSTPDQTDNTPFTTAMGTQVRDGIVAANFLPFKTRIMIPKLFGDKVFVVEDRMHSRFSDRLDIWFPDRASARHFGLRTAEIVVLAGKF